MTRAWPVAVSLAFMVHAGTAASAGGDPAAGQKLAQARCSLCHTIGRMPGPDNGAIPSFGTLADRPSTSAQSIAAVVSGPHMSGLNLPPDQASDVAAYVLSLRHP